MPWPADTHQTEGEVLQDFPKSYQFKRNKRSTPYRVQGRMQLVDPMLQFVA